MMKKIIILLLVLTLQSCFPWGDNGGEPLGPDPETTEYTPVFMDRNLFESSVAVTAVEEIDNAGKIYVFNGYLFINEKNDGFHIYDNSNPENPQAIKYIKIPGATDMAIQNSVIYINQATDLVAVQLSNNMENLTVHKRIEDVFPQKLSPDGFAANIPDGKIVINWIKED